MEIKFICSSITIDGEFIGKKGARKKEYAIIKIKNINTGKSITSCFTDFIISNWGKYEFNTQKKVANNIVPFLNYVAIDNYDKYAINTFFDIDFSIGEDFLNWIAQKNISEESFRRYERDLIKFYMFLAERNLLKKVKKNDFVKIMVNHKSGVRQSIMSPFKNIVYPKKIGTKPLKHNLPMELVLLFIETAVRYEPRIALGIYFEIFGGVRRGELTCLTKSAITTVGAFGSDGFILDIRKRDLRPDLKNVETKGQVKKPRYQAVLSVGTLGRDIYKDHLNRYKKDNGDALFINKNGMAMTAKEYSRRFTKVKNKFLLELGGSQNPYLILYAQRLKEYKWNTHICRGIFSNMIAKYAKNVQTLALYRGDSDYSSALAYLSDIEDFSIALEEVLAKLYEDAKHERFE